MSVSLEKLENVRVRRRAPRPACAASRRRPGSARGLPRKRQWRLERQRDHPGELRGRHLRLLIVGAAVLFVKIMRRRRKGSQEGEREVPVHVVNLTSPWYLTDEEREGHELA